MGYATYDYRCDKCGFEDEEFRTNADPLNCPHCDGIESYRRIFGAFNIIQRSATKDSSNSWIGSKPRTAFGKGKAVNGGF